MELLDRRERNFSACDKYRTFPGWSKSSHTYHRSLGEPISWESAGSRSVKNQVNWTTECGWCPEFTDHKTEKQRGLMERQRERRENEMMVKRGDLSNQWQNTTTHYRWEKDKDGFRANSYRELEERARWCYYNSLSRRRRLQGEMWREIQNALKAERISGSASRSVSAEPSQRSDVKISENKFNLVTSHQPPPYTSVKHDSSGKKINEQAESKVLSSSWSRPPFYMPPPPYTSRPDWNKLTGTLREPVLTMENRFGSRPHNVRQMEHCSVPFSDRRQHRLCSSGDGTPGTVTFPGPAKTQHQQEFWPLVQQQVKNQQHVFTPQLSEHHGKYQTSHSDTTLTTPKRRRSGGTVFCLVSHMGLSSSPNDEPLKSQSFTLFKDSTFTGTRERVQLADEADSRKSLISFNLDPTPEELGEKRQNQSGRNVRLSKHLEELRNGREELRKQSTEERRKKKREDTDSNKDMDNITPAVSSKSTTPVVPHHQTTLKFPLWKEPRSHHCSNGVLEKINKPDKDINMKGQCEQSEPRNNTNETNTGLVVIDATCSVIKVEFIVPPEKEHVQYVGSDSNCDHKPTEQVIDGGSVHKNVNQTRHTSGEVQPKHETLKERAERILGIVLQNSFNEEHIVEETTQMENSSIQQIQETSEGSAEAESERWLKAECENSPTPITSTPNEEEPTISVSEAEAILEMSEVTHRDDVNARTGLQIMKSTKQENEVKSVDRKFILDENFSTVVNDIREKQVKNRSDGSPSGESHGFQNLNQTILRNTSETFSQKCRRREDNLLHKTDERQDLNQMLLGRCVENTKEPFSQEDTPTEGSSSNLRGDHVENISDLLADTGDIQNKGSILSNSYEPDTSKVFDQDGRPSDENPSITFHNQQRTSEMFSLEGGQENLLNLQSLCLNPLSISETLHQESSPNQKLLSYSGDPQVSTPFLKHHVENTNESFAHEGIHRGEHISDVYPNLLHSYVLNTSDILVQEDLLREDRPSYGKHDANNLYQTLPGNSMENTCESCEKKDALAEKNLSRDVNNLHHSFSVTDIRDCFDEKGEENLLGEHVDQCVYNLNEGKHPETTDMKNFSPNLLENIEENPESLEQEASSKKDTHLDDLQNIGPILFHSSHGLVEKDDHEGITSPSNDLHHMQNKEELTLLLSTSHSEISPRPPDCVSSTFPSPPLPADHSFHSRRSDSLSEITSTHAQVCSSASSTTPKSIRVQHCPESLWDAVSRIRKHTAPDSESEDEEAEFWDSVENTEDYLINLSEKAGIKEEGCVLQGRSGYAGNNIKDGIKAPSEEERHLGERKDGDDDDDDDSLSSSSVGSQDTVIEGEGELNFLETDEEEKKNQESNLFSERTENNI
ncbi:hypothetical protein AMELA_G00005350 [Ameiurus melas]|uniref:Uncharacterized protein n=1 Tax=Ameiurus melas TaxID=219545 RepID=A0A7J6BF47_AMEME|nr:hypothetical protein AMELA_G00005350 [Ameiurus melas]